MADVTGRPVGEAEAGEAPSTWGSRLRLIGPGLVVAATGVGAGDMVSSLTAGTEFGTVLIWAVVLGAALKFALTEGLGRWYMATKTTILEGWHSMGWWASIYFMVYLALVTFFFGAAAPSASALATDAMFPGLLPFWLWAVLHSVVFGFGICIIGRYGLFERVMEVFVGLMFLTVVGLAVLLTPSLGELALGTVVPRMPEGSLPFVLAVIGGVGGTFTLVSYTYWVRERGWRRPAWIPMMRTDLAVGYIMTGVFMVAMLVIGAELLFANGTSIEGEDGLVALSNPISERFGPVASWLFLIGFWAAATSSITGAWNGGAYLFGDLVRTIRRVPEEEGEEYLSETGVFFRLFLAWITFPPMLLLAFDEPVTIVIVYASLGALFMPFLAVTLLWLLNLRVPREFRSGLLSNAILGVSLLIFLYVGAQEILGALGG
ncbi:divalent metal cation transporter [Rubrobacter tropicus]|uniref:Divalent metal cation transporter n=1 Tax=Rubrobacter tropicus TaxID=2653851 RepID=A0A6G8Q4D3_9ACTN|nr:Nramp family divalent metal transporter [Rubrobacter tropicus]QIN81354.1 divalent metal cation transporter [Rubrobacter tropicus]